MAYFLTASKRYAIRLQRRVSVFNSAFVCAQPQVTQ
jgi:hypothetical protein